MSPQLTAIPEAAPELPRAAPQPSPAPPVVNLLDDLEGLARRLEASMAARDWLDSFLLAAGMNQIVEDHLHRDVLMLGRIAATLGGLQSPPARLMAATAQHARSLALLWREWTPRERRVREWQEGLAAAVHGLAGRVVGDAGQGLATDAVARLLRGLGSMPAELRRTVLRMPTCFQSLDQDPLDCVLLAERLAERWPDRLRPVRVLGLRTSGSYLAPLVAASLQAAGFIDVAAWTMRPSDRLHRRERRRLAALLDSNALLAVVDDPPKTGSSLVRAVAWLERRGLPRDRIVMLVPLTGSASSLPAALAPYPTVVLPFADWTIHSRLQPESVRRSLQELMVDRDVQVTAAIGSAREVRVGGVTAVQRTPAPPIADLKSGSPVRRHVRAVFTVDLEDGRGRRFQHRVYTKGVGAGYFGRHSLTVASAVAGFVPETYGLRDGLLFRAWMPETARMRAADQPRAALDAMASYVLARRKLLAVAADVSERMAGLNPVWQRVADVLALPFARGRPAVRPLTHAAARRILRVDQPSVIDGSMALAHWFRAQRAEAGLVKVDYDERAYSNQDTVVDQLYSFDAVFDLAAAAADLHVSDRADDGVALADGLRRRFEAVAGRIADERWFLYQLIVLRGYRQFLRAMRSELAEGALPDLPRDVAALLEPRSLAVELERARDAMSSIDQQYWSRLMPRERPASRAGHVCAIDIDGVLETGWLGYSSVTPLGAISLRSLIAHGYGPVLVTGRSAGDVRDRCRAFGLAGGVAEYGAALYIARADRVVDLRGPADRRDLDRLRAALQSIGNVHVARRYRHAVRASLLTDDGPRPLPDLMVREQLVALGLSGRVRVIQGWMQTDFMVQGIDKGSGLGAMLDELGEEDHRLAFAAGDGAEDVPVMKLAALAVGPRNADGAVAAAGARLMRGRYQSGLAQGIELLVGHPPGACGRCRPPATSADEALLVAALSAQEEGRMIKLGQALRLAALLLRAR